MSEALLSCSGLSVRFGGLVALDALDLEVRSGAILGLIGPNGSGKTTLFNVITGVYRAAGGRAKFSGQDLAGMTPQRIYAAGVPRTCQRSRLALPLSVFDNVMIGNHRLLHHGLWFNLFRRSELRREFESNLAKARALVATFSARLAERMFDAAGVCSMIDRRGIEICRALVSARRRLLLDEPSAGMTHEETRELMDDLLAVRSRLPGLAIVIIEHEMNVIARVCERCAVLNYGRKIAEGSYAQVAADRQGPSPPLGTEETPHGRPRPAERAGQLAGTMSGGEQGMISMGRGLMPEPRLLLVDEPSLGLSPLLVKENFAVIRRANETGITLLLVEQNVRQTLAIAHSGYVLSQGRVVASGSARELAQNAEVHQAYFG